MFLIRMLFVIFVFFCVLVLSLGFALLLRIRSQVLRSLFPREPQQPLSPRHDGNVIEGEYKVIDESRKE